MTPASDGYVRYEIHNLNSGSEQLKHEVANYIANVVGDQVSISSLLIVEWKNMKSHH